MCGGAVAGELGVATDLGDRAERQLAQGGAGPGALKLGEHRVHRAHRFAAAGVAGVVGWVGF